MSGLKRKKRANTFYSLHDQPIGFTFFKVDGSKNCLVQIHVIVSSKKGKTMTEGKADLILEILYIYMIK